MDSGYVAIPVRPWLVSLNYDGVANMQGFNLPEINIPNYSGGKGSAIFFNGMSSKLSVGAYYRGWGLSYGHSLSNPHSAQFSFTSYGQTLGFDFNLQRSYNMRCVIKVNGVDGLPILEEMLDAGSQNGVYTMLDINAYYVFNSRRFSYGAALGQSSMQMRDAGSFFVGLTYYQTNMDFSGSRLANYMMANQCEVTSRYLAAGLGYGYNHVSANKQFLLHGSAMPMILVPVYNAVHMTPLAGNLSGDSTAQDYYLRRRDDLENYTYQPPLSLLGVIRMAIYWNITPQWVWGVTSLTTFSPSFDRSRFNAFSVNETLFSYIGFRF
ncbi:MAG: DUF4421 family protein [Bacteroidales bacterium]|nr:DUF4421 family protein [Bacteroidales bacterium]